MLSTIGRSIGYTRLNNTIHPITIPNESIGRNISSAPAEIKTSHRDNRPNEKVWLNFGKIKKLENDRAIIPTAMTVLAAEMEKSLLSTSHAVQYGMKIPQVKKIAKN